MRADRSSLHLRLDGGEARPCKSLKAVCLLMRTHMIVVDRTYHRDYAG